MTTTDTWANLPKWQRTMTLIAGVIWYLNQLDHPWLLELCGQLAHLKP
jgi:hypothetical protein